MENNNEKKDKQQQERMTLKKEEVVFIPAEKLKKMCKTFYDDFDKND